MFSGINTIWVLVGSALVFFMQAGFSMCEAGFTRAKNTGNILMKNLMDFCIGTPCFWLIGFGIMFGAGGALIGWIDPGIAGDYSHLLPPECRCGPLPFSRRSSAPLRLPSSLGRWPSARVQRYCIYSAASSFTCYRSQATGFGAEAG